VVRLQLYTLAQSPLEASVSCRSRRACQYFRIPDFSAVTWPPSVGHVQVNYGAHARGFPLPSVISHKRMTKQRIDKDRRAYERRQSPKGQRRQFPPQR
jgi:hypothetical protein